MNFRFQRHHTAIIIGMVLSSCTPHKSLPDAKQSTFYLQINANDTNDGSKEHPWRSVSKLNTINLHPGDSIVFAGAQLFEGTLTLDSADEGTFDNPIVVTSGKESCA